MGVYSVPGDSKSQTGDSQTLRAALLRLLTLHPEVRDKNWTFGSCAAASKTALANLCCRSAEFITPQPPALSTCPKRSSWAPSRDYL